MHFSLLLQKVQVYSLLVYSFCPFCIYCVKAQFLIKPGHFLWLAINENTQTFPLFGQFSRSQSSTGDWKLISNCSASHVPTESYPGPWFYLQKKKCPLYLTLAVFLRCVSKCHFVPKDSSRVTKAKSGNRDLCDHSSELFSDWRHQYFTSAFSGTLCHII